MSNELKAMSEETRRPWMDGFDAVFDAVYFDTLGNGAERQIALSELGILSHTPYFGNKLPHYASIPIGAIKVIKANEGYVGMTDPVKFALGARVAFQVVATKENVNV